VVPAASAELEDDVFKPRSSWHCALRARIGSLEANIL
jgi:hypothetical protein